MGAPHRRGSPGHRGAPPQAPPTAGALDALNAVFVAEARPGASLPPSTRAEIAFAGRSNVGKSTLLNRLCQRRGLARTSRTPGCTRGIVVFALTLRNGATLHLADLPGYGFAARARTERASWGPFLEDYLAHRPRLAGVVLLVDARRGLEPEEHQLVAYLRHLQRPCLVAVTKVDKLSLAERRAAIDRVTREAGAPAIAVSGATGLGREALLAAMISLLPPEKDPAQPGTDCTVP